MGKKNQMNSFNKLSTEFSEPKTHSTCGLLKDSHNKEKSCLLHVHYKHD